MPKPSVAFSTISLSLIISIVGSSKVFPCSSLSLIKIVSSLNLVTQPCTTAIPFGIVTGIDVENINDLYASNLALTIFTLTSLPLFARFDNSS